MNFFNFELKKIFIVAILVAIPLFSVNMQQKSKDHPWILQPIYYSSGFVQNIYASFSAGVRSTTDLYLNLIDTKTDNRLLKEELSDLKAQLGELAELKLENERLNLLLEFRKKTSMKLMAAKVIGRDLLTDYHTIMINRGENHGVRKSMGALMIDGVVGYVVEVEPNTSKILLITDRYAVIDGTVQRSRVRGIVQGFTKDSCTLTFLKRTDDVIENDIVVTSGLDSNFPKGFPVGRVKSVRKDQYGLGQEVMIEPVIDAANIEEVFIVLDANKQDFEPATADMPTHSNTSETHQ